MGEKDETNDIVAEEKGDPDKSGRVTTFALGVRWAWEKVQKANTLAEVKAAIAEAATMLGTGDIIVRLSVPPQGYLGLMIDAWLAWKYGEIDKPGTKELLDRALAVYSQLYLRALMRSRRERGEGAPP